MSAKHSLVAMILAAVVAVPVPAVAAVAQTPAAETPPATPTVKTFKLLHEAPGAAGNLDVEDVNVARWEPGIRKGALELSMSLGFMGLSSTLLQHDQMIYKYTSEATYWGDVKIQGQSAFNPVLRLGYNVQPWLTLEGIGGLSISEYTSTVENRHWRKNEIGEPRQDNPALGEYDAEARSLITLQAGVQALFYPFNLRDDGAGRWQPYLTGQAGRIWYDMNSDFTSGAAGSNDVALGGGLRLLAEKSVSLRMEAMYHINTVEFTPSQYFMETNEGTTLVPLSEFPIYADGTWNSEGQQVTSFQAQDMNYLVWSIGFQGTF